MSPERFAELMAANGAGLSFDEIKDGWHFCPEWDYLLVGPGSPEKCTCGVRRAFQNHELIRLVNQLKEDKALLEDTIQGFLHSRLHAHFDLSTGHHMIGLMFTEDDLVQGRQSAWAIGQRVFRQLDVYIEKLKKEKRDE